MKRSNCTPRLHGEQWLIKNRLEGFRKTSTNHSSDRLCSKAPTGTCNTNANFTKISNQGFDTIRSILLTTVLSTPASNANRSWARCRCRRNDLIFSLSICFISEKLSSHIANNPNSVNQGLSPDTVLKATVYKPRFLSYIQSSRWQSFRGVI